jgi:hypothetical protein
LKTLVLERAFNMIKCWAEETGSCSNVQSREHLVSSCYFENKRVIAHNLPWTLNEGTTVGKKKLTSKILCTYHNSALSLLDQEVEKISSFFRESHRKGFNIVKEINNGNISEKEAKKIIPHMRLLDGHIFEKWLLKTGINYAHIYRPDYYIGDSITAGLPSIKLLNIIFNNKKFANKSGLYFVNNTGANLAKVETIGFTEIKDETAKRIIGFEFYIWGWRFFLSLVPEKFVLDEHTIILPNGLSNKNLKYRKSYIQGNISNAGRHVLLCSKLKLRW